MENITPDYVDEEIKQLLYDKGFRFLLEDIQLEEGGHLRANYSLAEQRWNEGNLSYIDDLTIAIVVKWLYLKHKIWIHVDFLPKNGIHPPFIWCFYVREIKVNGKVIESTCDIDFDTDEESDEQYNTPEQAYLEAIKYALTKLI